jgi:hypothetical protein
LLLSPPDAASGKVELPRITFLTCQLRPLPVAVASQATNSDLALLFEKSTAVTAYVDSVTLMATVPTVPLGPVNHGHEPGSHAYSFDAQFTVQ